MAVLQELNFYKKAFLPSNNIKSAFVIFLRVAARSGTSASYVNMSSPGQAAEKLKR